MDAREEATLVPEQGMVGSVGRSKRRQVTLLSVEAWDIATTELGRDVDPSLRRANLLISGVELANTRGRVLRVGSCRLAIGGELTPCERMEEAAAGLQATLTPDWRGGVFAQVLEDGTVRVLFPIAALTLSLWFTLAGLWPMRGAAASGAGPGGGFIGASLAPH